MDGRLIAREWFPLPRRCAGLPVGSRPFRIHVNAKILRLTENFAREGRHVIGRPRLEENGICFDLCKVSDASMNIDPSFPLKEEDVKPAFINNLIGGNCPGDAIVIYDSDEEIVVRSTSPCSPCLGKKQSTLTTMKEVKPPESSSRALSGSVSAGLAQPLSVNGDEDRQSHTGTVTNAILNEDAHDAIVPPPDTKTAHDVSTPQHDVDHPFDIDSDDVPLSELVEARVTRAASARTTSDSETSSGGWEDGELEYEAVPTPTRQHEIAQRSPSPSSRAKRRRDRTQINEETSDSHSAASSKRAVIDTSTVGGKEVTIPPGRRKRARRLLAPEDKALPLMTVDLGSDFQFINRPGHFRISAYSMPCPVSDHKSRKVVEDAITVQNTAIIGYSKPSREPFQIAIVTIEPDGSPRRTNIHHLAHAAVTEYQFGPAKRNQGISALAAVEGGDDSFKFVSGGYDGRVYLWSIKRRNDHDQAFRTRTDSCATEHASGVLSLAYRRSDGSLLSAAGKVLSTTPLKASRAAKPDYMSNQVYQIHVHPQNENLILLETDHLNNQIQLFDTRKGGFDSNPVIQFGRRPRVTDNQLPVQSRHSRGSCCNTLFVRGFKDGVVKVWDIRKVADAVVTLKRQAKEAVSHTIFSGSHVAAYGAASVTFYKRP